MMTLKQEMEKVALLNDNRKAENTKAMTTNVLEGSGEPCEKNIVIRTPEKEKRWNRFLRMGKTEQREATGVRAGRGTKSLYCQSIVGHKVERGTWKVKTI